MFDWEEFESQMRELEEAAKVGDKERIDELMRELGSEHDNDMLLQCAAENGQEEVVTLLLARENFDLNKADAAGQTALYYAVQNDRVAVAKLLLAQPNVDANLANIEGRTPLNVAVRNGHREMATLLLSLPAIDVNRATREGHSPLLVAAAEGKDDLVELLLAANASIKVNAVDRNGQTPLLLAAQEGHAKVAQLLLAASDIDVNRTNKRGQTPLFVAAKCGSAEVLKVLLIECCVRSSRPCVDAALLHSLAERGCPVAMFKQVAAFAVLNDCQEGTFLFDTLRAFHCDRRRRLAAHSLRLLCFDRLYQNRDRASIELVPAITLPLIGEQLWAVTSEVEISEEDYFKLFWGKLD